MNKDNTTSLKSILILFDLLKKINQKEIQYLKQLYLQNAENFEDCIDFVSSLNLIYLNLEHFEPTPQLDRFLLKQPNKIQIKEFLVNKLLSKRNIYIWEYLEKFCASNEKYIFEPQISENLKFSNLRNLLIELEFISYNPSERNYEITEKYIPLFIGIIKEHQISPEKLKNIIEAQDRIGKNAELEIVAYEKSRLSDREDLVRALEHKSLEDATAGYDIRSFTICEDSAVIERFIEVKAISKFEKKFYMTRNEIEISRKNGLNYYLYLLPVIGKDKFDLANLIIIQDPNNKIFSSNEWVIECEQFSIMKRGND